MRPDRHSNIGKRDPLLKNLLRWGYGRFNGAICYSNFLSGAFSREPRVFYGGARAGDIGGPLVKVRRLQEVFPESRWPFNILYSLSNTPYVPEQALRFIRSRGVGIVHNQNGVFYPGWFEGDWKGRNEIMSRAYHLADHVFWQSEFCRQCADEFLGKRGGGGEILYNAVDLNRFTPQDDADKKIRDSIDFLITGKLEEHLFYRVELTMRGLAAVRKRGLNARLKIAGYCTPTVLTMAVKLAEELKLRLSLAGGNSQADVMFLGAYSQEEAPAIYQGADVYVMLKHNDPCPNTVIEAMACGLPVIYANSGGVPELVGEDAGVSVGQRNNLDNWLTPIKIEGEEIADAMCMLEKRVELASKEARARAVAEFGMTQWIGRHREIFNSILGASQ